MQTTIHKQNHTSDRSLFVVVIVMTGPVDVPSGQWETSNRYRQSVLRLASTVINRKLSEQYVFKSYTHYARPSQDSDTELD